MSKSDTVLKGLVDQTLRLNPLPKAYRGLSTSEQPVTRVSFENGQEGWLFGFSHERQIATFVRKRRTRTRQESLTLRSVLAMARASRSASAA
jgi:hypothetical protein